MNLVFSYSIEEDNKLAEAGFEFLGAGHDKNAKEVHVFQLLPLAEYQAEGGDEKLEPLTNKASMLVEHDL
jgi:hypothetical protein